MPSRARASRSTSRCSSASQPAALNPKVIGSAWMPWLRPTIGVSRYWSGQAPDDLRRGERSSPSHDAGRVAQDDRGGRVEHVRAREPVMEPAALRPEPLGHRAQERDDVVLRLALDLARRARASTSPAAAPDPLVVRRRARARLVAQRLDREQLDPQPQVELVLLAEQLAQLGQGVAVDHLGQARGSIRSSAFPAWSSRNAATRAATPASERARIRAARCAGVLRTRTPDRDGRHRHPGRHLHHRVEGVGSAERAAVERDPDDRLRGQRCEHARQMGGQSGGTDEEPDAGRSASAT